MSKTGATGQGGSASVVTVALCCLVALFEGFDLQAAGVAAPRLGPAFQLTPGELGWFFSSSTFGLMLGAAVGGRLSDRLGRKAVLIASVALFGLLSLATAQAPTFGWLLAARFLTGVGLGGALPNLVALAAENAPPERRNTAVGLLYAAMPAGGAAASLISALGASSDWRMVFYVGGLAPLLAVPLLIKRLPESRELEAARSARADRPSGVLTALFGEGRALRTLLLWIAFFLALLTMYLLLNWLPSLLVERGLSRREAALVQVAFNGVGALASGAAGVLMDRVGAPRVVAACFLGAALGLVSLAFAPPELAASLVVGGLAGLTVLASQAVLYAMAPGNYPAQVRGAGVGAAVAVGRAGSAVGPLLAAALLGAGRSPQAVLSVLVPIMLLAGAAAVALSLLMARRR